MVRTPHQYGCKMQGLHSTTTGTYSVLVPARFAIGKNRRLYFRSTADLIGYASSSSAGDAAAALCSNAEACVSTFQTAAAPGDVTEAVQFPMAVPLLPFAVEEVFLPGTK
jgi:hypothetical protein